MLSYVYVSGAHEILEERVETVSHMKLVVFVHSFSGEVVVEVEV